MDCKTAQQLAGYLAPGKAELDAEHSSALEGHLRVCPDCARRIRADQAFDQRVARVMRAVPVPATLKNLILERLAPPRPAWYRRPSFRVVAAAAAVLIAVAGVVTWQSSNRVRLDVARIADEADRHEADRRGAALNWLTDQEIAFAPGTPINLNLVAFHGKAEFQGKMVPALLLVNAEKGVRARVYVVRSDDFDFRNLLRNGAEPSTTSIYGQRVEVLFDQNRPEKVAYVVIYTGDSLEPFRDTAPASA